MDIRVSVIGAGSWGTTVAALAAQWLGAAYVPIDPGYPAARIRRMLSNGSGEFSGTSIRVIPAAISAAVIGSASCGWIPRRIAMISRLTARAPSADDRPCATRSGSSLRR